MTFLLMVIGAVLGAFICAGVFQESLALTAAVFGAFIGLLLAQLSTLRQRLTALEQNLVRLRGDAAVAKAPPPAAPLAAEQAVAATAQSATVPAGAPAPLIVALPTLSAMPPPPPPVAATPAAPQPALPPIPPATPPRVPSAPRIQAPSTPDPITLAIGRIKTWFTEGNVPVKVGVIVLFLGVGALLKYASDAGWLRVPVEFRLAGIAAAALAALVFAWRKRESHRAFALSLQGGAIGVLILVIFAAYRLYALLPSGLTFALLVIVVAAGGLLAVLQNAPALAVLAIVGGFLAPILASTGSGSHVALFGYYAVLNAAIFAIAWVRPWRALNLLGFAFTFGIGTFWGVLKYQPEFFPSTEPFLLLFFAFYLCIPVLYARKLDAQRDESGSIPAQAVIDGTLVFGTPLVAFALQASLLYPERMTLAYSALGAAAIYTLLAWLELRRLGLRVLGESHALLALGFATLSVPLALSARLTASTWALEGAALVWLGLRQQRRLPRWIGYGLQLAAGIAYFVGYEDHLGEGAVLNGAFMGALLIAFAGGASSLLLHRRAALSPLGIVLFLWAWAWWLFACSDEIVRFAPGDVQADWWLALIALTGVVGAEGFRRLAWRECAWPALAMFLIAPVSIVFTAFGNHGVLEGWGAAAWIFWLLCALRALGSLAAGTQRFVHAAHFVYLWTVALVLGAELAHVAEEHLHLGDVWIGLAALAPFAALFWCALARYPFVRWPADVAAERGRFALLASVSAVLGAAWFVGLFIEGEPAPLPYFPLVNPLELSQLGFLMLLLAWYRHAAREGGAVLDAEVRARILAAAGIVLLTAITLRGAHFVGGVPWDFALWESPLAQAALSIVWTIAGIAAMLLGKQRGSRAVWIGGGALMGVVIVKLLLIDRQHLQDLAAIVGVLVVGVLLIGVGYFAPVPPRKTGENA